MTLFRMLSFTPEAPATQKNFSNIAIPAKEKIVSVPISEISPPITTIETKPSPALVDLNNVWIELIGKLNLSGLTLVLAQYCALQSINNNMVILHINPSHAALVNNKQKQRLQALISVCLGRPSMACTSKN